MGAPDLLKHLRSIGLTVTLTGDKIIVAPKEKLTDPLRAAIRAHRVELMARLTGAGRPYALSLAEADRCHTPCWDDSEIAAYTARVLLFVRRGVDALDADDLAERLVLRGRELDDRRLCLECAYGRARHCPGGKPLPSPVLHRCGGFLESETGP